MLETRLLKAQLLNDASSGDDADEEKTLGLSISNKLRNAIMCGELEPGSKLKLNEVRKTFGVSHSPLREALAKLTVEGLVQGEDNRGYWVSPISLSDFNEIVSLRMEFEAIALRESIRQGGESWKADLANVWEQLQKIEAHSDSIGIKEEWESMHRHFHLTLLNGCKMPLLLRFIDILLVLSDRYRRLLLQVSPGDRNASEEHRDIVKATVAGHSDLAVALLRLHIERTGNNVKKYLDKNTE